ncbi:hypothetical protein OGAPHI_006697 [Ogataea philodendri]|uniref:Phosphotransferase n=1 Tax=Ogataea philodendri TaxID=1378263 RepID=A0A9P8NWZ4_9ASCO|nr:uncharacterized protein OGAPHI_006697 [Ogataea philodendri]KAH3661290.1 hypothetical protein OGAPHI_006697 [Ogataea philodendri]
MTVGTLPLDAGRSDWNLPSLETLVLQLGAEIDAAFGSRAVTMLPTLTPVPDSHTHGKTLILDLGGSTFRACIMGLHGDGKYVLDCSREWSLDAEKEINTAFFQKLVHYAVTLPLDEHFPGSVTVGLSICFPFRQTRSNDAYLDAVGKGFVLAEEIRGLDVARLLQQQLETATNKPVHVRSVINDAVAVYVAGAYLYNCQLGLVLGTGLNASASYEKSVINTEMSCFGSSLKTLVTTWDLEMQPGYRQCKDAHLQPPLFQPLEYFCSGRYIGELLRLAIIDLHSQNKLFPDTEIAATRQYELTGEMVCRIYHGNVKEAVKILKQFKAVCSPADICVIRSLIEFLVARAARVLAAWILAFCQRQHPESATVCVGYIGSFFQHFELYRQKCEAALNSYTHPHGNPRFLLRLIDHSTALGAAISACQIS